MKTICLIFFTCISFSVSSQQQKKQIRITKKYLNFPISYKGDVNKVDFFVNGKKERYFDVRLANGQPDYWVFADVTAFKGKTLTLSFSKETKVADLIYQADAIAGEDSLYKEKNRPGFHFSTRRGWNNDPNGLVFYKDEYHLFYQHNPFDVNWGNMTWGHAVSKDLIHWKELPPALYPDELGSMFSGSAVVDYKNTSGFREGKENVMVAAYTADLDGVEVQCIAYSNDKGRTWNKYARNPVIESKDRLGTSTDTRDPKIFWHKESGKWVLVLFEKDGHSFFNSDNLREWTFQSHVKGFYECPEFFELPVDGNPGNKKWVLYGANGSYMLGKFDGKTFTPESEKQFYLTGKMYAAQTFNNIPESDGRRIQIGWGQSSHPGMPFNMMMSFPTQLTLQSTDKGIKMFSKPIAEIQSLDKEWFHWNGLDTKDLNGKVKDLNGQMLHVKVKGKFSVISRMEIDGNPIMDSASQANLKEWMFGKEMNNADQASAELEILIDRTSIEVFVNKGEYNIYTPRGTARNNLGLQFVNDTNSVIDSLEVSELNTIW